MNSLNFPMDFYRMIFKNPSQSQNSCIAIMGGGGKTGLLLRLGKELSRYYNKVLMTSLTKSGFNHGDNVVFMDTVEREGFSSLFEQYNPLFIMHSMIDSTKLVGISVSVLNDMVKKSTVCLFECDGARNRSLKVHNRIDPEVPDFATHIIIVVGADVVNTKLSDGKVHRPDLFAKVWKIDNHFTLDVDFVTKVVTSKTGYLSKVPNNPALIYFVNKAEDYPTNAELLAQSIFKKSTCPTFYGSLYANFWKAVT
ncbi:MAG: putative selenium-dependent hydroxylase accessory protein YqeC [Candidatus Marinimicrobia bacterium]|nr:putative selenium-dependent hydroxylase accessory protein YqeC [Candidatus Neomarinimicrobiota bacterium]